ncbi:MAG: HAD family hydrolase, partial [candidate division WOR-3 bacterium]
VLPSNRAVFFDRDGTLCEDSGYINKHEQLIIFPQIESLKILKKKGFKIVGLTNQSGIARGIVDEKFVKEINEMFKNKYGFDDFYYCPHHPDDHCPCRKPEPEMILKAKNEHGVDLKRSYVVGDKDSDMLLAKTVGAKGILVQTGKARESEYADFIVKDLKETVDFIIRDSRK